MLASALALALSSGAAISAESTNRIVPANLSSTERTDLAAILAEHIQLTLKDMKPLEGQLFPTKVTAQFKSDGTLMVELGRRFIVKTDGTVIGGVEDQLHGFTVVLGTVAPEVEFVGTQYLFEGKNIGHYYPELADGKNGTSAQPDAYPPFPPYVPPPVHGDPGWMYVPPQPYSPIVLTQPSVAINQGMVSTSYTTRAR